MDLLLILTYTALAYAAFKIFRIPVNKWTVPTAGLGGIILVGTLILLMSYNHPFTSYARIYYTATPIIPTVVGRVTDVPVEANAPLKKGDVLFHIDARPYQYVVDQKRAALAEAELSVKELKAALDAATSVVEEARAQRDSSKQEFERANTANENARSAGRPLPISEQEVENKRGAYLAAEASVTTAQARAEQARLAFTAEIGGVNPAVARLNAELQTAEYELGETTVRAPTDGFVTQVFLRPGMMAMPFPLRPVMVFVNGEERTLAGAFIQNSLQRVVVGDEAEVAFRAVPGRIFKGRVKTIIDVMAQGQLQASGEILDPLAPNRVAPGRALAVVELLDDISPYSLPGGVTADIAIYSQHWHHVAVMRKVLLRMNSWLNYVFLEH